MRPNTEIAVRNLKANGFEFRCRIAGDTAGIPVVLLHGFPETSAMYAPMMQELAAAGYYCLAPDLRGYSPGARPEGAEHYRLEPLAQDVPALATAAGMDRFHLVGHDWGAGVGWHLAAAHPARLMSWSALSVPHLQSFFEAILRDKDQRKKSRYLHFFQWKGFPEWSIRLFRFRALRKIWYAQDKALVQEYLGVLRQKGALTAALNYYRGNYALLKRAGQEQVIPNVQVPTLFIYGNKDFAIGRTCVERNARFVTGPLTYLELSAGHWLVQEKPAEVLQALRTHFEAHRSTG